MTEPAENNSSASAHFKLNKSFFGIGGLASMIDDHDVLVYIIKSLYRLVFYSNQLNEPGSQLIRRIQRFERDSLIPGFLSSLSVDQLLEELEEAQYYYPIYSREITLPRFR